jgi:hypothetical protein
MGNPPFMGSPVYRTLIRRQCELLTQGMTTGISYAEARELGDIEDKMTLIEMAAGGNPLRLIEAVTDDYAQLMAMGDLGGVELS